MASVPELSCTVYADQYSVNHEVCEYSTINELKENDVICGRGKHCFNHPGNRKFRYLVETFLSSYAEASCKLEESIVVSRIVDEVQDLPVLSHDPIESRSVWNINCVFISFLVCSYIIFSGV